MSIVNWGEVLQLVSAGMGGRYGVGYVAADGTGYDEAAGGRRQDVRLAFHQAMGTGRAATFLGASGVVWGISVLEDRGRPLGGIVVGPLEAGGDVSTFLARIGEVLDTVHRAQKWVPELLHANRTQVGRQAQFYRSVAEQREQGFEALYDFEQERVLLAAIRAGDRDGSRIVLNELLTPIFMESSSRSVLRARAVELVTRLTRTALEDNPMMTVLWAKWRDWTSDIIRAESVEVIARAVMDTLEGFIEGVFVHGARAGSAHVHRALSYISENYARPISLREVARDVGVSPSRLAHLFRDQVGRTVLEMVHEVRIRRARVLLERSDLNCAEIAYEVGYSDQSYFTRVFRRHVGVPPRRYRESGTGE